MHYSRRHQKVIACLPAAACCQCGSQKWAPAGSACKPPPPALPPPQADVLAATVVLLVLLGAASAHMEGLWPAGLAALMLFSPYFVNARL